jgi:hypothetical protein
MRLTSFHHDLGSFATERLIVGGSGVALEELDAAPSSTRLSSPVVAIRLNHNRPYAP